MRAEGTIVGMTTLVVFRVATGVRAFIDEVVVLDAHRGLGLGEKLVRAAIANAQELGAQKLDLTSRPHGKPPTDSIGVSVSPCGKQMPIG